MSKTIAKFKCTECDHVFTATSEDYTSCKCGKCCIKPEYWSTSYKNDDGRGHYFKRLPNEWDNNIINDITYYYADDFYIMTGDILNLFTEVKELCKELDFHIYESFKNGEDGSEFLSYISYTKSEGISKYSNETNEIKLTIDFEGKNRNEEKFKNRLLLFRDFLTNMKNNNINISDRKQMLSDKLDLQWERKQLEEYDYTFYF